MTVARTSNVLVVLVASGVAACSGVAPVAASSVAMDVTPRTATIGYRQSIQLNATVTGTALAAVAWTVDCGSVTQTGLFTAPDGDAVCHVVGRPQADATKSASATVTVTASPAAPLGGWGAKCAAEPMRTTGKTYYACDCGPGAAAGCKVGNDNNAGTDPSAAVRSLGKAAEKFRGMNGGDTVALCRGGVFDPSGAGAWTSWINHSCRPGTDLHDPANTSTCILRDYDPHCAGLSCMNVWGSGSEGQPQIKVLTQGNSGFLLGGGGDTGLVQGVRFLNLTFANDFQPSQVGGMNAIQSSAFWSDFELCNSTINNFDFGYMIAFDSPCGSQPGGHRIYIRGNRFTNNQTMAMLVDFHDSDVDGNYFDHNGDDAPSNFSHILNPSGGTTHTLYLSSACDATNVRIINNEVHHNASYNGGSTNSVFTMGGGSTNLLYENNYFDIPPAPGFSVGALFGGNSYGPPPQFHGPRNLTIRRNRIVGGRGRQIGWSAAQNATIEDNVIVMSGDQSDTDTVIMLPHGQGTEGDATSGGTVRNNTVYINATAGNPSGIWVTGPTSSGNGFNITGNSVTYAGSAQGSCFTVNYPSQLAFMDRNHCSGASSFASSSGNSYSLANWRTQTGRDSNSITAAPQFMNAPTDLTPAAGSPLIGAGSTATNCTVGGVANQSCSAASGMGTATWSTTDSASSWGAAPNVGAYAR